MIEQSFSRFRANPAFACDGKQITYGELDSMSAALAAWLQSRGLEQGARVAIMMPNVLQYPISICAVLRAGYVVVNVNPLYTPRELQHQLNDSGAEAIVILDGCTATLDAILRTRREACSGGRAGQRFRRGTDAVSVCGI